MKKNKYQECHWCSCEFWIGSDRIFVTTVHLPVCLTGSSLPIFLQWLVLVLPPTVMKMVLLVCWIFPTWISLRHILMSDEGTILLLLVTEPNKASYSWWDSTALWAYNSCKQFYVSNTVAGGSWWILQLGSGRQNATILLIMLSHITDRSLHAKLYELLPPHIGRQEYPIQNTKQHLSLELHFVLAPEILSATKQQQNKKMEESKRTNWWWVLLRNSAPRLTWQIGLSTLLFTTRFPIVFSN